MSADNASNIFQIRNGDFSTLPERPMRQGFYGETLEAALQRLLAEHPEVLPGNQLASDDEEAPRFLLLKREASVGAWSLDHLFVDQFAVPTLVECKLLENRESRREVMGQIIEYAANARAEWGDGQLRDLANRVWSRHFGETDELLGSELGVEDADVFWQTFESNLESGRIRLIIAGDHVHASVKRMIEYLNSEMQNTEVYGLEVNCFGPDSDNVVMITRVIGRVQSVVDKRAARNASGSPARARDLTEIRDYFGQLEDTDVSRVVMRLLDWACEAGRYSQARTRHPSFHIECENGPMKIGIYSAGDVWVILQQLDEQARQDAHQSLLTMGLTHKQFDGKKTFQLENLTTDSVNQLTAYLDGW